MPVDILLGLQWGDEGKGKIVDVFTPHYDIITRFQGGPNAGHTIEFQGSKHVLHHIPSGIFRKQTINLIGNGVILDPNIFCKEISELSAKGINAKENLYISNKAHLILPTHRLLDVALERKKGNQKIGSTLKGIGPTYTDKVARHGIRVGDILQQNFYTRYQELRAKHLELLKTYGLNPQEEIIDGFSFEEYESRWLDSITSIKELNITDSEHFINAELEKGKKVLAEGAQGTLLDVDFGFYPYVTSSNTLTAGVCSGLGIAPSYINRIFGIFKAYCTRVGSGPFPTELNDDCGQQLRDQGHEYGATTGRPRRCGWLDLPALKYAIMINGITDLVITKADVFKGFNKLKICEQYLLKGNEINFSNFILENKNLSFRYKTFNGWEEDISQSKDYDHLPNNLKQYLEFIEASTEKPISVISTSADRTDIIFRHKKMFN